MWRLKLITGPAVEPVTLSEVKNNASITHCVYDTEIARWIKSCRRHAEKYMRRSLVTQTWEVSFDSWPCSTIDLPRSPVQSITSVTYYDYEDTPIVISSDNYRLDISASPARLSTVYGYTWPSVTLRSTDAVKIRYVTGYGDVAATVPNEIKDGIIMHATERYNSRAGEFDMALIENINNIYDDMRIHL